MADDRLERELVDLGRRLDVPAAPDLTYAVREALAGDAVRPASRTPWWRRMILLPKPAQATAAALLAFVGAFAVSPQVRAAVGDALEFAGIELRDEPAPPIPTHASPLPGQESVSLQTAREAVDFQIYVPAALGAPDAITTADGGRIVSLLYEAREGQPAIVIDQFGGSLRPVYQKYLDVDAEPVTIGPYSGFWLPQPHELLYVDRSGEPREEAVRLAGRTLIWQVGDTTLRMEGDLTRDEALEIAISTVP